jgi:hypothetical protein
LNSVLQEVHGVVNMGSWLLFLVHLFCC